MPVKVSIRDFQILEECDFEVSGITIVCGKSNGGKSAISRAIRSACLGRRGDDFIRYGAKKATVSLDFGDNKFVWSKTPTSIDFYLNDQHFTKTGGVPTPEYVSALKVQEVELGKLKVAPNFAKQFDSLFLLDLSPVDAAASLSFLFSGEKFPLLLKTMSKHVKDAKQEVIYLEGSINSLSQQHQAAESNIQSLTSTYKQVSNYNLSSEEYEKMVSLEQHHIIIYKILLDCSTLKTNLKALVAQRTNLNSFTKEELDRYLLICTSLDRYEAIKSDVADLKSRSADLEAKRAILGVLDPNLPERLSRVSIALNRLNSVYSALEQLRLKESSLSFPCLEQFGKDEVDRYSCICHYVDWKKAHDSSLSQLKARLADGVANLAKANQDVEDAKSKLDVCPYCTSILTDKTREGLINHVH